MTMKQLTESTGTRLSGIFGPTRAWARPTVLGVHVIVTDNSTGVSARRGRHP